MIYLKKFNYPLEEDKLKDVYYRKECYDIVKKGLKTVRVLGYKPLSYEELKYSLKIKTKS